MNIEKVYSEIQHNGFSVVENFLEDVTSVKNDPMLSVKDNNIHSFYIGDGIVRTKFFLELKAKILIMDMPDFDSFLIKRSKIFPVHFIYIFHSSNYNKFLVNFTGSNPDSSHNFKQQN